MAIQVVTNVYDRLDTALVNTLGSKVGEVISVISPIIQACFVLYFLLVAISYMKTSGDLTEIGIDFLQRFIVWGVVIGLALNAGNYTSIVVPIVNNVPNDIMSAISGSAGSTNVASELDNLLEVYKNAIVDGWNEASGIEASFIAAITGLVILITAIVTVVVSAAYILLAKVFVTILLVLGPIFIAMALFPPTRQFASIWVAQCVNYGLVLILTTVLAVIQVAFLNTFTVELTWTSALELGVAGGIFTIILLKIPDLASGLSNGMTIGGFRETGRSALTAAKTAGSVKSMMGGKGGGSSDKGSGGKGGTIKPENKGK